MVIYNTYYRKKYSELRVGYRNMRKTKKALKQKKKVILSFLLLNFLKERILINEY